MRPGASKQPLPTERFEFAWRIARGPTLERELMFHPQRKWRFDYAHACTKVAIEINGAVRSQGRHNRGLSSVLNKRGERVRRGYLADLEKVNAATCLGWRVFQLGGDMVDDEEQIRLIISAIAAELPEGNRA